MVVKVELTTGRTHEIHTPYIMGLDAREFKHVAKNLCEDGFFLNSDCYIPPHMIASVVRVRT